MDAESDLKTFQSEVFNDFRSILATMAAALFHSKGYDSPGKFKEIAGEPGLEIGLIMKRVLKIFSFMGKRAEKNILKKSDFIYKEKQAAEIVENPKIKKLLCRALEKEISHDLFYEALLVKMVKITTSLLLEDEIIKEFPIEKDVRLFSLITVKIYREGIGNYCE